MLQPVSVGHKALGDYRHLIGRALVDEIQSLAEPLQGKRVLHVSATAESKLLDPQKRAVMGRDVDGYDVVPTAQFTALARTRKIAR